MLVVGPAHFIFSSVFPFLVFSSLFLLCCHVFFLLQYFLISKHFLKSFYLIEGCISKENMDVH
jgi:hypothetical protein